MLAIWIARGVFAIAAVLVAYALLRRPSEEELRQREELEWRLR